MPKSDDDILVHEIGQVGALGGSVGGGRLGSLGGRLGGILGATLLPTKGYERTVMVHASVTDVVAALVGAFRKGGRVLGVEPGVDAVQVTGLVLSGFFNMNPAILSARVAEARPDGSLVTIVGKAKEGLINQHTAEKAVRRVVEGVLASLPGGAH